MRVHWLRQVSLVTQQVFQLAVTDPSANEFTRALLDAMNDDFIDSDGVPCNFNGIGDYRVESPPPGPMCLTHAV